MGIQKGDSLVSEVDIEQPKLTDIPIIDEYLVCGVIGGKGQGKSLVSAILAEGARVREQRNVFFFPETYRFHAGEPITLDQMFTMDTNGEKFRRSVVIVEEMQRVFSKFGAATLRNQSFQSWLQQIRKLGMILIWNSNDPEQIDSSIIPQTDIHMTCHFVEDESCKRWGFHKASCEDRIICRVVDTNRQHGRVLGHLDGRKRFNWRIRRVMQYYKLYNTYAAVSAHEIAGMNAASVRSAHEETKANVTTDQLETILAEIIIPHIVLNEGWEEIFPKRFASWLAAQNVEGFPDGIDVTDKMIGQALRNLGIVPKRHSQGMRFVLPSKDDLERWQAGGA